MKRKVIIILLFVSLLLVGGCTNKKLSDSEKFKKEYEVLNNQKREKDDKKYRIITIPEDNPYIYQTAGDIIEKMDNKETFVVYFGFAECPWCRSVLPTLTEVAMDLELDTIYYVDIQEIRDSIEYKDGQLQIVKEGSEDYYMLLSKMNNVLEKYEVYDQNNNTIDTKEKRIYAPNVVSVVNGKAQKLETGISDKLTDPYMELTEEITKETYNKFKCSIKCVLETETICTNKKTC